MPFDFSKLRGRIVERFGTCGNFAAAAGKTAQWVSTRLNNVVPWSADEIKAVCEPDLLDICPEDIPAYFFTPKFR
jgi:hypothetical protein